MFYLTEFFKSLGESFFRGMSFFFFSCLLAMALTHRPWIARTLDKITPEKMTNPYFVAVLDGSVNPQKVKTLVGKLPGVLSIDDKDSSQGKNKLEALVSDLGSDYSLSSELMDFNSLRVVLN